MWDTLVREEECGRKVVSVRGSGGLRYTLLREHPSSKSDKKTATHNVSYSYGSYFLEYSFIMAELYLLINLLLNQKLPSIYCILSAMSSLTWFLFIRQGPIRRGSSRLQVPIENVDIVIYNDVLPGCKSRYKETVHMVANAR